MKIIPIVNSDFIYRYRLNKNKVIDTLTGTEYTQASISKANDLLNKLNKVGMQNAKAIDTGKGTGQLLSVVAW